MPHIYTWLSMLSVSLKSVKGDGPHYITPYGAASMVVGISGGRCVNNTLAGAYRSFEGSGRGLEIQFV